MQFYSLSFEDSSALFTSYPSILHTTCQLFLGSPALRPTPCALDHRLVVHPREELLLQVVEGLAGDCLIDAKHLTERLLGHTRVLELGKQDLAVLGQERARGVTVIHRVELLALHGLQHVPDENGRLCSDGCRRLGRGEAGSIAGRPDIGVLLVASGGVVDVDVTSLVRKSTVLDKRVGAHLGHDVQKVELLVDLLFRVKTSKSGRVAVDGDEVVLEQSFDAPLLPQLLELGAVLGHAEHGAEAGGEADVDGGIRRVAGVVQACLLPVVQRKPHDFLRAAGTLDYAGRLSENGGTFLELLDGAEDLVAIVVAVGGRDKRVRVGKSLGQALDAGVVDADAGRDNKLLVVDPVAIAQRDKVFFGGKGAHALVVELELRVNQAVQWSPKLLLGLETTANQSPSGLIVVPRGGVDNSNVILDELAGSKELMADGKASATATDDHDPVIAGGRAH